MSKFTSPHIPLLATLLLVACQSVPEPAVEAQQPEVTTVPEVDSSPQAQTEPQSQPDPKPEVDYSQQAYEEAIDGFESEFDGDIELFLVEPFGSF